MRTTHADFTEAHRKISPILCEDLLPRDSRLPNAGSVAESARRVGQSREFIERHLDQRMTIELLATRAGVSISHFFKLFKEETGCAPVVYMTRLKMERARDWLITTDWSIKLIAADLGYHDPLYFSRVFKSLIGMAPKAYRQSRKRGQARRISATVR